MTIDRKPFANAAAQRFWETMAAHFCYQLGRTLTPVAWDSEGERILDRVVKSADYLTERFLERGGREWPPDGLDPLGRARAQVAALAQDPSTTERGECR